MSEHLPIGWALATVVETSEINPSKSSLQPLNDDTQVSFVPMKDVEEQTGKLKPKEVRRLTEVRKGYTYFAEGDIIFAKITPCMENGKVAIARNLKNGIGFGSTEFHVVRPSKLILPKFLLHFLLQESFRSEAKRNMTGTAGQLRVPTDFISTYNIAIPPLNEQKRIVEKLEQLLSELDKAVDALKTTQEKLKTYRRAVLKAAVEGEQGLAGREQREARAC